MKLDVTLVLLVFNSTACIWEDIPEVTDSVTSVGIEHIFTETII